MKLKHHTLILMFATLISSSLMVGCVAGQAFIPKDVESVIETPNLSQNEVFNKTRQWFSQYFVSGKSVVDYENSETGTIIGNGIADNGSDPFGIIRYQIHFNIRIDTKDGKFRATTKILKHTNTDSKSTYDVNYLSKEREDSATAKINKIVQDIKAYITDSSKDKNSNW